MRLYLAVQQPWLLQDAARVLRMEQDKSSDGGSILQGYDSEIKLNDMEAGER